MIGTGSSLAPLAEDGILQSHCISKPGDARSQGRSGHACFAGRATLDPKAETGMLASEVVIPLSLAASSSTAIGCSKRPPGALSRKLALVGRPFLNYGGPGGTWLKRWDLRFAKVRIHPWFFWQLSSVTQHPICCCKFVT
jgi:hypothetical protein